jgi:hypothetical protein
MDSPLNLELLINVVNSAPLPIAVYIGEELRIVLANDAIIKCWDKGTDVIGKLYSEILPELTSQGIVDQARNVLRMMTTEIRFTALRFLYIPNFAG